MNYKPRELNLNYDNWQDAATGLGVELGFSLIETKSFEHQLLLWFGNEDTDTGSSVYIKEDKLENHLYKILQQFNLQYDGVEVYKKLLQYVINLYNYEIEDYTFKEERMSVRISTNLRSKLNNIDGDSFPQKLNNLVKFYEEHR